MKFQPADPSVAPVPVAITPELLKQHGITPEEYQRIESTLGRTPSLTELGIYSVMWSEHCSYKSSRVHLRRLPTESERVVQGPGENAGIIDVGDGWACAFKIESHNHPSYIEPYQGAATGVGGILRDIFTMGARPLAVMDSLRFGPIREQEAGPLDLPLLHKNHSILEGVVHGIAGYGNCFGVPNLAGETRFESCYSGNPLVNAFALGLVRRDEIFYAKASGVGNPVIYVGAKTGRDGIHGATMASEEFKEGSEQKRPNVQVGDPFMEKLLLEACIEAMKTGVVVGIQDMGAAGLTSSGCEMGARGGVGIAMNLDQVPQRETGMNAYELMLSESQERMLLVAEKGREGEVLKVFTKWGLDGVVVGEVIAEPRMRIWRNGVLEADIPNQSLTDDAPRYHRPIGEWKAPVAAGPTDAAQAKMADGHDYVAELKDLLAASNLCSKRYIYEQYDSMVQTNTAQGPGGEAGVMRIKESGTRGHERGLAMALAGNGRWCYLDPKLGAMHSVAEAARKVACTGATPVAATNCLNFGNPEKPEIMAQLSQSIDGMAEACTAFGTPITGGNVSLYNETRGEGIYPTPVVGVVGVLDDVTRTAGADFSHVGDSLYWVTASLPLSAEQAVAEFGSSEYARIELGELWGVPPAFDLAKAAKLVTALTESIAEGLVRSACDVADGGLAVALARAGFAHGVGAEVKLLADEAQASIAYQLFGECGFAVLLSVDPAKEEKLVARFSGCTIQKIGQTVAKQLVVSAAGQTVLSVSIDELHKPWAESLEAALHEEELA